VVAGCGDLKASADAQQQSTVQFKAPTPDSPEMKPFPEWTGG
jgi:hypothetical protein